LPLRDYAVGQHDYAGLHAVIRSVRLSPLDKRLMRRDEREV